MHSDEQGHVTTRSTFYAPSASVRQSVIHKLGPEVLLLIVTVSFPLISNLKFLPLSFLVFVSAYDFSDYSDHLRSYVTSEKVLLLFQISAGHREGFLPSFDQGLLSLVETTRGIHASSHLGVFNILLVLVKSVWEQLNLI